MVILRWLFSEGGHFFEIYKQLEEKQTMVDRIEGREEAERIIEECIKNYDEKFSK